MSTTREQLYAEVWAEPMTTVAARYEVSSNSWRGSAGT
jgi:hypothetical protein